ncbi:MAG: hypothetical protein J6V24_10515 [Clostridia bacterium]|nr:hypothetical protein [Clostridia bacterium]
MKHTIILLALTAVFLLSACVRIIRKPEDDASAKTASLSFDSFEGGGPTYSLLIEDPSMASFEKSKEYKRPGGKNERGAGYTVTFVITGLKPGETYALVSARSPIAANYDSRYAVIIDEDLNVTVRHLTTEDLNGDAIRPRANLVLEVNGKTFYPGLADNSAAEVFLEKLEEKGGSLELILQDDGDSGKAGILPWDLPRDDKEITAVSGDIILYGDNRIAILCGESTRELTKLGRIEYISAEDLRDALGEGDAPVTFWLEWDE